MSAGQAVRVGLVEQLRAEPALAGVQVSEAGGAASVVPRVEVAEPQAIDWSATAMRGREMRTAIVVRVADGQRGRLGELAAAVERAGEALTGEIDGWRVAGAVFLRSRAIDEKGGIRAVLVEHRVRMVEA